MFRFKWLTPTSSPREITLDIHSQSGWFGSKVLKLGDQTLFRRGRFGGIEHRFRLPEDGQPVHLQVVQVPGTPNWRPVVMFDGSELAEQNGTHPPTMAERPPTFSAIVGLTFLFMLMAAVMVPSIVRILNALHRDVAEGYSAAQDIAPWVVPYLVSAVCLLGYWNMRKWSVFLYMFAVAAQGGLSLTGIASISMTALMSQVLLCLVGLAHLSKMR